MKSRSIVSGLLGLAAATPVPVTHQPAAIAPHDGGLGPFSFTSTFNMMATPDQVVDMDSAPAPGEAGAMGFYNYGINSELDIICYVSASQSSTNPRRSPLV